jgi:aryl-alcohol dehydrogenase-like predicted oxidoreductase
MKEIKAQPILGTAMWGWTVPKEQCFEMLSYHYSQGYREVDTATNYPIDKNPEHFRLAEKILLEWFQAHGVTDLKVMMKVGSLNNMMTPDQNLSKSFLLLLLNEYQQFFGDNLHTFMIHWDNRDSLAQIEDTFEALLEARTLGLQLGLSGIKHPDFYQKVNEKYQFKFRIQAKHNLLYSKLADYAAFHEMGSYIAYGINAGGFKLDEEAYNKSSTLLARGVQIKDASALASQIRQALLEANQTGRPNIESMNHCGLIFAGYHPLIEGILLGTSRLSQLKDSLDFLSHLKQYDYQDFYDRLRKIHEKRI